MKRRDEQQDVILENIYEKVDKLHGKAKDMGGVRNTMKTPITYFFIPLSFSFLILSLPFLAL